MDWHPELMLLLVAAAVGWYLYRPPAVFVVRVIVWPLTGMSDVAETTVVPTTAEVMVTVQVAVAAPPV